jgi:hypothetical protein
LKEYRATTILGFSLPYYPEKHALIQLPKIGEQSAFISGWKKETRKKMTRVISFGFRRIQKKLLLAI